MATGVTNLDMSLRSVLTGADGSTAADSCMVILWCIRIANTPGTVGSPPKDSALYS